MKRYIKNNLKRSALYLRSYTTKLLGGKKGPVNVYHACIQKTASQWVKAVFSDPYIMKKSGLRVHPQFRYEVNQFKCHFPRFTFVPGLYIPYILFTEIDKPDNYKTIYVIRDPRDIVVSWYYSMRYTHGLMGTVPYHRKKLKSLGEKEGIEYCIKHLQWKFSFLRSWWVNRDDPTLYLCRFENLTENKIKEWSQIFNHCEISISNGEIDSLLKKYTKKKMRKRDKKSRDQKSHKLSHYREDPKGWEDMFTTKHEKLFKRINGTLVENLGYEW